MEISVHYSGFRSNEKSVLNFRPISIGFLSLPILIRAKTAVVRYLYKLGKLEVVLSPNVENCSSLLKKEAKGKMFYLDAMRKKLEFTHTK